MLRHHTQDRERKPTNRRIGRNCPYGLGTIVGSYPKGKKGCIKRF